MTLEYGFGFAQLWCCLGLNKSADQVLFAQCKLQNHYIQTEPLDCKTLLKIK